MENETSPEFVQFADEFIEFNCWTDKREIEQMYAEYNSEEILTPHRFKKWLEEYSFINEAVLRLKSVGSRYLFKIEKKVVKDDENNL